MAELSSCDSYCLAYKAENTYYLALHGNMFADPWNRKYVDGAYIMTLAHEWLKFGKCQSDPALCFVTDGAETQGGEVCPGPHRWEEGNPSYSEFY